jgi:hypothetical protein
LNRFDVLQTALLSYGSEHLTAPDSSLQSSRPDTTQAEEDWLIRYVNQVVYAQPEGPLQAGSAVGCVLGWLMHRGCTGAAPFCSVSLLTLPRLHITLY